MSDYHELNRMAWELVSKAVITKKGNRGVYSTSRIRSIVQVKEKSDLAMITYTPQDSRDGGNSKDMESKDKAFIQGFFNAIKNMGADDRLIFRNLILKNAGIVNEFYRKQPGKVNELRKLLACEGIEDAEKIINQLAQERNKGLFHRR